MKRLILIAGACLALGACASTGKTALDLEKSETDAELAYVGIATTINSIEVTYPDRKAKAEAIKVQAWNALLQARQAYAAGQAINLALLSAAASEANTLSQAGGQ